MITILRSAVMQVSKETITLTDTYDHRPHAIKDPLTRWVASKMMSLLKRIGVLTNTIKHSEYVTFQQKNDIHGTNTSIKIHDQMRALIYANREPSTIYVGPYELDELVMLEPPGAFRPVEPTTVVKANLQARQRFSMERHHEMQPYGCSKQWTDQVTYTDEPMGRHVIADYTFNGIPVIVVPYMSGVLLV